jgi:hypothetical protein
LTERGKGDGHRVPAGRDEREQAPALELQGERPPAPALEPLGEHERPRALLLAVAACALLAAGVLVGGLTVHDLSRHGGSLPGAAFLAAILASLAQGMYRRRYWAVLGFEALLAFQILVTSLALVVASTIAAAAVCLLSILLGGFLFWKLIRVMARIQAGAHAEDRGAPPT